MARPTDYNEEIAAKICSGLAEGKSLRTVCQADDMPDKSTVFVWLGLYPEFKDQYARAKEESADADNETLEEIGDEAIDASWKADPKAASAVVQAYKLKADNLKWAMSKKKPKKYGEKLDLTSGGEKLPTPIYGGNSTKPKD